jgi:hypothetical protein
MPGDDDPQEGQGPDISPEQFSPVLSSDDGAIVFPENGSTPYLDDMATASLNGHEPGEVEGAGATMTLFEHLAELRKRVLICAVAVVVTSIAGYFSLQPGPPLHDRPVPQLLSPPQRHDHLSTGDLQSH